MRRRTTGAPLGAGTVLLTAVMLLAACEPLGPLAAGDTEVRILLSDAVAMFFDTAKVDIGAIELIPKDGGDPVALTDDATSGLLDLVHIRDDRPEELALEDVDPGEYAKLRLVLEAARVELASPYGFVGGGTARDLTVPTAAQSGVELNLDLAGLKDDDVIGGIEILPGLTTLVLDFDVNQSFIVELDPDVSNGVADVVFTPAIRVAVERHVGSIAGTVFAGSSGQDTEGLRVTARPLSTGAIQAYQTQSATTLTDADGSYTLEYIVPGSYVVDVSTPEGFGSSPTVEQVDVAEDQEVAGINFSIVSGE